MSAAHVWAEVTSRQAARNQNEKPAVVVVVCRDFACPFCSSVGAFVVAKELDQARFGIPKCPKGAAWLQPERNEQITPMLKSISFCGTSWFLSSLRKAGTAVTPEPPYSVQLASSHHTFGNTQMAGQNAGARCPGWLTS